MSPMTCLLMIVQCKNASSDAPGPRIENLVLTTPSSGPPGRCPLGLVVTEACQHVGVGEHVDALEIKHETTVAAD